MYKLKKDIDFETLIKYNYKKEEEGYTKEIECYIVPRFIVIKKNREIICKHALGNKINLTKFDIEDLIKNDLVEVKK